MPRITHCLRRSIHVQGHRDGWRMDRDRAGFLFKPKVEQQEFLRLHNCIGVHCKHQRCSYFNMHVWHDVKACWSTLVIRWDPRRGPDVCPTFLPSCPTLGPEVQLVASQPKFAIGGLPYDRTIKIPPKNNFKSVICSTHAG